MRFIAAAAEYALGRELRSVLDVGCGEALWRAPFKRARPGVDYVGLDPSEYVVRRWGRRRGIRQASFGELGAARLGRRFDLVVCSDVMQYVPTPELRRGLQAIRDHTNGVAYLSVFTTAEEVYGDLEGWLDRSPAWYRREFARVGLRPVGMHLYLTEAVAEDRAALEMAD